MSLSGEQKGLFPTFNGLVFFAAQVLYFNPKFRHKILCLMLLGVHSGNKKYSTKPFKKTTLPSLLDEHNREKSMQIKDFLISREGKRIHILNCEDQKFMGI